jgi:hypothetical protein
VASAAQYEDRSPAIGRVLTRAFSTIGANPLPVFGITFLLAAVPQALVTVISLARPEIGDPNLRDFVPITASGWFASLVFSTVTQGALARVTASHAEGGRATIGEALRTGLRAMLPLLGLGVLMTLGLGVGFALLFVPGVMLWVTWSVAAPALAEERCGVLRAFARSRELTRGARWKIFALELVVFVFYWLIAAVIGIASIFFSHVLNDGSRFIIWSTTWAVANKTLAGAVWGTIRTSLYVELRDWKDGPASRRLVDIFA